MLNIQYRPRALQHLHAHKLRAIWRISTKNPRKKLACKFLHELLHADFFFTRKFECTFTVTDFAYKNTRKLRVFLHNRKCGWCKIRNRHCAKTSFRGERENNVLYTFSYYDPATIANVMFCNQGFPWLLAEALVTCKLGCMLLATTVVLK